MNYKDIIGKTYTAKVDKIVTYGAFVKIAELKTSALLHISNLSDGFVKNVRDYVNENDTITVEVLDAKENRISVKLINS